MIARRAVRRIYSRLFTSLCMMLCGGDVRRFDARRLRACTGAADTLRIVAPGGSVGEQAMSTEQLAGCHVLGINYFSLCVNAPLWPSVDSFVIEPHPTYPIYVASIADAVARRGPVAIVVKGLGSPVKFRKTLAMIRALAAVPQTTLLLSEDRYVTDLSSSSYAEAIVANPDHVVSGSKTLLWALSFAYASGYRRVILHGFDFSQDYAYGFDGDRGAQAPIANVWVSDREHRSAMLSEIARLRDLFADRGISLMQHGCRGPLPELLPSEKS